MERPGFLYRDSSKQLLTRLNFSAWFIFTDFSFTNSICKNAHFRRFGPYYGTFVRQWRIEFVKMILPILNRAGETIEQAAVREAREDTGLTVEIERLSGMYNVYYPAHVFPERKGRAIFMVAFRCRIVNGTLTLNEEVTEFGWFDPRHLPPDLLLNHRQRILDAAEP